jgi:hypothetical protein
MMYWLIGALVIGYLALQKTSPERPTVGGLPPTPPSPNPSNQQNPPASNSGSDNTVRNVLGAVATGVGIIKVVTPVIGGIVTAVGGVAAPAAAATGVVAAETGATAAGAVAAAPAAEASAVAIGGAGAAEGTAAAGAVTAPAAVAAIPIAIAAGIAYIAFDIIFGGEHFTPDIAPYITNDGEPISTEYFAACAWVSGYWSDPSYPTYTAWVYIPKSLMQLGEKLNDDNEIKFTSGVDLWSDPRAPGQLWWLGRDGKDVIPDGSIIVPDSPPPPQGFDGSNPMGYTWNSQTRQWDLWIQSYPPIY